MARTRDLVALSAILVAPLAAILVSQALPSPAAQPVAAPAPVDPPSATPEPARDPAPMPEPVVAPELAPAPTPAPVDPAPRGAAADEPGRAILMRGDALVLHTHADIGWASGRPVIKAEPSHLLATRAVPWDSLPERERGLAGATMVVHAADGGTCIASVGAPRVHLEQTGDVYYHDDGEHEIYEPPTSKSVLRDMIKKLFAQADDLLLLARQETADRRPCAGVWARRADLPPATVYGSRPAPAALAAEALAVVRAQPEFAALAGEYADWLAPMDADGRADIATWDAFVATNFAAASWHEIGGPRQIVSVELKLIDRMPCSDDFGGSLTMLLGRRGDALVRLDQPGWFGLTALMDLEGDGVLEAVTADGFDTALHTHDASGAEVRDGYHDTFIGCPC